MGVAKNTGRPKTSRLNVNIEAVRASVGDDPGTSIRRREQELQMTMYSEEILSKLILSDEAHFHLDGFINCQNCRFWGSENPHVIVEKQMHPQRVTVWAGGIIGPYFFENEVGQAVTVASARYRDIITLFFLPKLDDIDVANMWFR